tara:strand:- start:2744 stop:3637 length:894 start_codon:yes stop_codon:yes gene_type:complete
MKHIEAIINDEKPDLVHIQNHGSRWSFILFPAIKNIPIVNTVHDPFPHLGDKNSRGFNISRFFAKRYTDRYIVHGHSMKKKLVEIFSVNPNLVDVIPHGNLDIYKNWETEKSYVQEEYMLFFGRIWKYKGLHNLIMANNILKSNDISYKLVIAGTGDDINYYKSLIKDDRDYEFKNYFISNEELPALFRKSSFVVLPYTEATQSGVVALAYSFGKPVIVTNVGSMPEYVKNGKSGIIIDSNNLKQLGAAIRILFEKKEFREKLSRGAENMSSRHLNWSRIGKMFMNVYNKTLSNGVD